MEINIVPLGTGTPSVSQYVKKSLDVLTGVKNINYELNAMGTVVEADSSDTLFKIARKMHREVLNGDIKRLVTSIKIDERTDKNNSISGKLKNLKREGS
ncbi:MAG: MTH1187 family thiamine-binding protein [Elusimicrobiota bacterium]